MTDSVPQESAREHARTSLIDNIEKVRVLSEEQHAFKEGLLHIMSTTYMSTDEGIDALLELFPREALLSVSCLKMNVLFFHMRAVLQFSGETVEQRRGLFVPQAVSSALYSNDSTLKNRANELLAEYRLRTSTQTSPTSNTSAGPTTTESNNESSWKRVDAANRRFKEYERYSGILAQWPNLAETRKVYLTYCGQKDLRRADRVKLISCVLKGTALNY